MPQADTMSKPEFANSSFLIYSMFETTSRIGGSLLVDCAITEQEAQEKVRILEERSAAFDLEYPSLVDGTKRITYIKNKQEWWTSH